MKIPALTGTARAAEAEKAIKYLLSTLLGNRELLLACVLSGRVCFLAECRKSFRGMLVTDDMLEHLWRYIAFKAGPRESWEFDYEWLITQREQKEEQERLEQACLKELSEKAHGKDAAAELNMRGEMN